MRARGSFSRQRDTMRSRVRGRVGAYARQRRRRVAQDRGADHARASSLRTAAVRSPARRAGCRARTGRYGCRRPRRAPAREPCTAPCPTTWPAHRERRPERRGLRQHRRTSPARSSFASPKSRTLTRPSRVSITFAGFRSRCTTPFSWAAVERLGERDPELDDARDRQSARSHVPVEALALDQLHGQEAGAARVLDGEQRDDAGVVERGDGARLVLEAGQAAVVLGHVRRQHLERDLAAEARIPRAIDLAHARPRPKVRRSRTGRGDLPRTAPCQSPSAGALLRWARLLGSSAVVDVRQHERTACQCTWIVASVVAIAK